MNIFIQSHVLNREVFLDINDVIVLKVAGLGCEISNHILKELIDLKVYFNS